MVKEDLLVIKCNGCSRELKCVGEGELSIVTINVSCSHCNEISTYTKPKAKDDD